MTFFYFYDRRGELYDVVGSADVYVLLRRVTLANYANKRLRVRFQR